MKKKKENALRLSSAAPITDGGREYNKLYFIFMIIFAIIVIFNKGISVYVLFGALIGLVPAYVIKETIIASKLKQLRHQPFALDNQIPYDKLIQELIPVLTPLQMTIEKDKDGRPIITYKKMIYDIEYHDNNTFTIWWRKPILKALLSVRGRIPVYREVVVAMGIIGYHIQQICSNPTN